MDKLRNHDGRVKLMREGSKGERAEEESPRFTLLYNHIQYFKEREREIKRLIRGESQREDHWRFSQKRESFKSEIAVLWRLASSLSPFL